MKIKNRWFLRNDSTIENLSKLIAARAFNDSKNPIKNMFIMYTSLESQIKALSRTKKDKDIIRLKSANLLNKMIGDKVEGKQKHQSQLDDEPEVTCAYALYEFTYWLATCNLVSHV